MKPNPSDSSIPRIGRDLAPMVRTLWTRMSASLVEIPLRPLLIIWAIWVICVHLVPSLFGDGWPVRNPNESADVWPYFMAAIQTPLSRWDSRWFHEVVERGYFYYGPSRSTSIDYYPLYPLMVRGARALTGLNTFRAGTLVSAACTLGSVLFLARASSNVRGSAAGLPSVEALLFFPSAFVLATVYSDSTTLVCFLAAVHLARSRAYVSAGLAAFAAGLTHPTGWLILVPLVVIALQDRRGPAGHRPWLPVVMGVAGVLAFPGYLWAKFGSPLLFLHGHRSWFAVSVFTFLKEVLLAAISALTDHRVPTSVDPTGLSTFPYNCATFVLMLWVARASYQRRRWDDLAFMVAACLMVAFSGSLHSLTRYALAFYPIYLRLGELFVEKPIARSTLSFIFVVAQVTLLSLFVRWYFVF